MPPDSALELKTVIDAVKDYAIFTLDRDGTVLSWNAGAHEIKGYTEDEIAALRLKLDGILKMLRRGVVGDTVESRVRASGRLAVRMSDLVERMLDASRIVLEQFVLTREPVDLAEIAREVVDELHDQAAAVGSEVRVTARGDARGRWDRGRLAQVATNLVANAVKYGAGKPIDVEVDGNGTSVRLVVVDHGVGISEADAERIFDRFERAVPSQHYGGLGLGLYITRHVVEAHGGTIGVRSRPGQGATFTVVLPR